jgi:hypothetical protein
MATNMATNGRNVKVRNRSRIAAQNLMEGDECLRRGEPSVRVVRIQRTETLVSGTVKVTYDNGETQRYNWDERVSIVETPERHRYRRNSLRRNGYQNYLVVRAVKSSPTPTPTPKRKPKSKRTTRR